MKDRLVYIKLHATSRLLLLAGKDSLKRDTELSLIGDKCCGTLIASDQGREREIGRESYTNNVMNGQATKEDVSQTNAR